MKDDLCECFGKHQSAVSCACACHPSSPQAIANREMRLDAIKPDPDSAVHEEETK